MSRLVCALLGVALLAPVTAGAAGVDTLAALRARPPADEILYFLVTDRFENGDRSNDRGGLAGGRDETGYDPTDAGYFHGGDLSGVLKRLDYIQHLGATALWLTPVFRNQVVQRGPGGSSAGYHGYWILDFTSVDPHLGTRADLERLIAAAHARGLKVYLDIVVNHTADVIRYRECPANDCAYRARADYPYTRRGGVEGPPINPGFSAGGGGQGDSDGDYAQLTDPRWAYTPYLPPGSEHAKRPEWLNDLRLYHNRGATTYVGESSLLGDFGGLDDVMTEHPRVRAGMIELYGRWIDELGIDGYRIDTARHVEPAFWAAFVPAMQARARARGIPHFHIFGEVFAAGVNPLPLAEATHASHLPAIIDFAFAHAVRDMLAGAAGTDAMAIVLGSDVLYAGGASAALELATFVSNHDQGRMGFFLRQQRPGIGETELLQRLKLANAMLLLLRGVPVLYYGDEQGLAGEGDDRLARQDLFHSAVPAFRNERGIGARSVRTDRFDPAHPLYQEIAALARVRSATPALRRGRSTVRASSPEPGLLAVSRFDPADGREVLTVFNTGLTPVKTRVPVSGRSRHFETLAGRCGTDATDGSFLVELAPLSYAACRAVSP